MEDGRVSLLFMSPNHAFGSMFKKKEKKKNCPIYCKKLVAAQCSGLTELI